MADATHYKKAMLRREALARRGQSEAEWRAQAGARIADRVYNLPEIQLAKTVALYSSFGHEFSTHDLIRRMIAAKAASGGAVVLPRTVPEESRLAFMRVTEFPAGCRRSFAGILEPDPEISGEEIKPAGIDVFVVPGLLFDRAGNRLGYGGGYYDRALEGLPGARCIASAFSFQVVDSVPADAHDVPVSVICTEDETITIK